jgi:hypothetical protein
VSLARVRALIVVGTLVVLAVVAAGWAIARDSERGNARAACVRTTVPFRPAIPKTPTRVRLNVYNATSQVGLANHVADELRSRGFRVGQVGNDPLGETVTAVAQLRYGPQGAGAAQMLRAVFPGAQLELVQRSDAGVDVVLGMQYERLATAAEYTAERRRLGAPTPPPELC